jgi:hypothetical protein
MNSHPLGKAVVNALELVCRMRDLEKIRIPDGASEYFPGPGRFIIGIILLCSCR